MRWHEIFDEIMNYQSNLASELKRFIQLGVRFMHSIDRKLSNEEFIRILCRSIGRNQNSIN